MRATIYGITAGLAAGLAAGWLLFAGTQTVDTRPLETPPAGEATGDAPPSGAPPPREPEPPALRTAGTQAPAADAPFPAHEFELAVGQAYTFGAPRPGDGAAAESSYDVLCQDIRHGAVLRAPHGAAPVGMPTYVASDALLESAALYARIDAAPLDLAQRDASLHPRASRASTGMAFVQARDGRTYKLRVLSVHGDPRVWERRVRIRYEEVPQREGAGRVDFGPPPASADIDAASVELLDAAGAAARIPGDSFRSFLKADGRGWRTLTDLPPEVELDRKTTGLYVALKAPLATTIRTRRYSGILAGAGIAPEGRVEIGSYTALVVEGDLEGHVDVGSYAYIHITGDLVGTLDCHSYATVRVDGDVRGTLKVRSYVTLYAKGRFLDPARNLDCKGSCWSTFFLDGTYSLRELRDWPATSQITLHVREADADPGTHVVPPWREVIVGAPAWARLR